jgi:YYY domain-containing protein
MMAILMFWLSVQLFALAVMPLAWRLLHALPERGYVLAKPLGLLLVAYVFWLGVSVGLLRNTSGGILGAGLVVAGLSWWLGREGLRRDEQSGEAPLLHWLRCNWRLVVTTEVIFAASLVFWVYVRSFDPGISSTEKPMEFAFFNGILRSETFPPLDPWLSGYAISYYYFGYVMMAILTRLSGAQPGVGFIAASALWFSLTVTAAFGVSYDLTGAGSRAADGAEASAERAKGAAKPLLAPLLYGALGSLFVAVLGNLEGLFELLHAKGIGSDAFYRWLDVKNLATAPTSPMWYPGDNWWWWRASRVIHDKTLAGVSQEVIDEFPIFSFLLGDMHPHVLALPFVLLIIGLALNLLLHAHSASSGPEAEAEVEGQQGAGPRAVIARLWAGVRDAGLEMARTLPVRGGGLLVYGLCIGSLGFLNTWDILPYLLLMMLAYGAALVWRSGAFSRKTLLEAIGWGVVLVVMAVVAYLPFFLSFSSQAGGVWPNLYNPTRFVQFFLMFGTFLVPAVLLLALGSARLGWRSTVQASLRWLPWTVLLPLLFLAVILLVARVTPQGKAVVEQLLAQPEVAADVGGAGLAVVLRQIGLRRLTTPVTYLFLASTLAWILGILSVWVRRRGGDHAQAESRVAPEYVFVLFMMLTAFLLTFAVEFVFLKDTFGTRMNTVFKFYYQAWLLLALASAYAVSALVRRRAAIRSIGLTLMAVLVASGVFYPVMATYSKSNRFVGQRTLDGFAYVEQYAPDEAAAIAWLRAEEPTGEAVVLEAPGGSFRAEQSRVSSATGLPTLLGWSGHELQWRGSYDEPGRREPVVEKIYRSAPIGDIPALLEEWQITYVFVGPPERSMYGLTPQTLSRLDRSMDLVFERGEVRIYRTRYGTALNDR